LRWIQNDAWRYEPQADAVLDELETAYSCWEDVVLWKMIREDARKKIVEYDWPAVWETWWRPLFAGLEKEVGEAGA